MNGRDVGVIREINLQQNQLKLLPWASRASDRVTPPASAPVIAIAMSRREGEIRRVFAVTGAAVARLLRMGAKRPRKSDAVLRLVIDEFGRAERRRHARNAGQSDHRGDQPAVWKTSAQR